MRITKLELQNFKRFTDLTIDKIPATSKLVLLIGANGSGKSSVFDGFDFISRQIRRIGNEAHYASISKPYYFRNGDSPKVVVTELNWNGFDKAAYIKEITMQKNEKLLTIASGIEVARQSYSDFKDGVQKNKDIEPILQALKSDDFETFYPFFSMKTYYSKIYLQQILNKLAVSDLVKTNWFKTRIEDLLR